MRRRVAVTRANPVLPIGTMDYRLGSSSNDRLSRESGQQARDLGIVGAVVVADGVGLEGDSRRGHDTVLRNAETAERVVFDGVALRGVGAVASRGEIDAGAQKVGFGGGVHAIVGA